ncbi:DEAD/DEAH box helicase family protein [bacterium]|nr:DEAD/DEAH box helicase family protein [bacterium]
MAQDKIPPIIDNTTDPKIKDVVENLLNYTKSLDIATGYFEIGSLLQLDGLWQKVPNIRIIMGDEITKRTKKVLLENIVESTNENIEEFKEDDDFNTLSGLEAIKAALNSRQIIARVYNKTKFHAKAHIYKTEIPNDYAMVGSSNFTAPGLTENVELNAFITDAHLIEELTNWYNKVWDESEPIKQELLKTIERHTREFSPFEVWIKVLAAIVSSKESMETDWDQKYSVLYDQLSRYQQDGYLNARKIADTWGGAFVCDGVGLGKTLIGLMLMEYYLGNNQRVMLIVPKSARKSVWERDIKRFVLKNAPRHLRVKFREQHTIFNHTDLGLLEVDDNDDLQGKNERILDTLYYFKESGDAIVIDEGHHFRTPWAKRSKVLKWLMGGERKKKLFMLTATPLNNTMLDIYHLINYLAQDKYSYFSTIGIQDLRKYFNELEKRILELMEREVLSPDIQAAAQEEDILRTDMLLGELVVQRSRKFVKEYEERQGETAPIFPERQNPEVVNYSLKAVYENIYEIIRQAFSKKGLFCLTLAVYNPEISRYRKTPGDNTIISRNLAVVGLIRTLLLKRIESSWIAFRCSLETLLWKMGLFMNKYDKDRFTAWEKKHGDLWKKIAERLALAEDVEEIEEDNEIRRFNVPELDNPENYHLDLLLNDVENDMQELGRILNNMYEEIDETGKNDDKLHKLIDLMKKIHDKKVVIFTEFKDTARYLQKRLSENFESVQEIDSTSKIDRESVIKRFAPYYNCDENELEKILANPINILISTDVLSEGLNLQDADVIVNYDLHWNPVRLMQRIGRIDRRLNPEIEEFLDRDSPPKVYIYNFIAPLELEDLLNLYKAITGKLLRISKTFGIEAPILGGDEWEPLRNFNELYEGSKSPIEELKLKFEDLKKSIPNIDEILSDLPFRILSGKRGQPKGLFACYQLPNLQSPEETGEVVWYYNSKDTGLVSNESITKIAEIIESTPETSRIIPYTPEELTVMRKEIDKEVRKKLRDMQAPVDAKEKLLGWMVVS